ncbi:MAG: glycosyltransferase family 4 protein [Pelosinus sp.]|nr:glycosyltransferase family 4 protein [Pelosinus sp.]
MYSQICENVNHTAWERSCLLKYITEPFIKEITWHWHQNLWQARELAKIVGEFGYNVDVINYNDSSVQLHKKYDLLVDNYPQNLHLFEKFLQADCKKVYYSTTAAPNWQYCQEQARLEALYARRGARLAPRFERSSYDKNIACYDAIFLFGNELTRSTYTEYPPEKIFLIKNTGYSFLADMDVTCKDSHAFLFLASHTQVLKGLDLLLEVFAKNKDLTLLVCSNFAPEKLFCKVYENELFKQPNILPIGFIDIGGELFKKITRVASFVVLPSCTEGMAGSVLTGMSAGLIPIVSRFCGFNEEEVFCFEDCSVECIAKTLVHFSKQSKEWIAAQSMRAIKTIQTGYNAEDYSASVKAAMIKLLAE